MASDAPRYPSDPAGSRPAPVQSTKQHRDAAETADKGGDLPRSDARRWYSRDKRKVIAAVRKGALGFHEACRRYRLSYQEFVDWERLSGADDRMRRRRQDNERRRYHRIAMRSPASLRVEGRRIECEIENLSATGALLMVDESRGYPPQVALEVPHSREALPARVAWRARNALGIEFDAASGAVAAQFDNRWIEGSVSRGAGRR